MTRVEFIYNRDCPNVREARANLLRAFSQTGKAARWQEWDQSTDDCPEYARSFGSPTILIEGRDVAGTFADSASASSCRIYLQPDGSTSGIPGVSAIAAALRSSVGIIPEKHQRIYVTTALTVGAALLPKIGCPACWPAYAAVLSSFGIGFVNYTPYMLPLTATFLMLTLVLLGHRAKRRNGYGPLMLGFAASILVLGGKYLLNTDAIMFIGIGLLVCASLWNSLPLRAKDAGACPSCVQ